MENNLPKSASPVSGTKGTPNLGGYPKSQVPVTAPSNLDFNSSTTASANSKRDNQFLQGLTSLFGFRKKKAGKVASTSNMEFVKVDAESPLSIAQAKAGKILHTKLSGKLEQLFDGWLNDTSQTYLSGLDRQKRIAELQFAIDNNSFLSQASALYADEACQAMDNNGKLIQIECADPRMEERMEDLLKQWGITQNRLRAVGYNLAVYGDAFWSNKVTPNGVIRCMPLQVHQVKERLEFNPVQVQSQMEQKKGYMSAINRNEKLKMLFDSLEGKDNQDYSDLFDTKLFGYAMAGDMVVAPWVVTHFRLNPDQSMFFPMGESVFLKCLAPFRQLSATKVLQSLARIKSFPITVYEIQTHPGMDEAQQFDKINDIREQYENVGDTSTGNEATSVNTTIWAPKGVMDIKVHSPNIDINATNDLTMYADEVAIASGIPKGYLIQEYGGYGNSAVSLIEQFKPFARKVYTVQSAILEGITNLFRLHFAITGEFDYRADFVLSMKFPNEEASDARNNAKTASLELASSVLDMVASLIGAIDDPLPPEIIQDILKKFSFLDPDDIKKWIKPNPNAQKDEESPEEFDDGGMAGGLGGGGGAMGGGMPPPEGGMGDLEGGDDTPALEENPSDGGMEPSTPPTAGFQGPESKRESYIRMERKIAFQERQKKLTERYFESKPVIYEKALKEFSKVDEATINNRHFKYSTVEACNIPMYELLSPKPKTSSKKLREDAEFASPANSENTNEWTTVTVPSSAPSKESEEQDEESLLINRNNILSIATAINMAKDALEAQSQEDVEREQEDGETKKRLLDLMGDSFSKQEPTDE